MSLFSSLGLVQPALQITHTALQGLGSLAKAITPFKAANNTDTAEISPASQALSRSLSPALLQGLTGIEPGPDGSIRLEDILAQSEADLAALQEEIGRILSSHGIDTTNGIMLQVNENGEIEVTNEHPQADAIEDIFRANPDLANSLRRVSANLSLARAAQQAKAFHAAYRQDPQRAVAQFPEVLNPDTAPQPVFLLQGEALSAIDDDS